MIRKAMEWLGGDWRRAVGVALAVLILASMCSPRRVDRDWYGETYIEPNRALIVDAVREHVGQEDDPACIRTFAFPFDTEPRGCPTCEALVEAGLLERSEGTAQRRGREVVTLRYELTAAGRPLYTESLAAVDGGSGRSGLCFGRTVVDAESVDLKAPFNVQRAVVEVRYALRVENPHEILFGPHAKRLGLPELRRVGGATLPPRAACAHLANGVFKELFRGSC